MKNNDKDEKQYLRNKIIQRHKNLRKNQDLVYSTNNKLIVRIHQKTGKPLNEILKDINEITP